jgi:hypothetical protein
MTLVSRLAVVAAFATISLAGARQPRDRGQLPHSTLALRTGGTWTTFWRSGEVLHPRRDLPIAASIDWHPGLAGVSWAELDIAGSGEAWRTRIALVRLDPDLLDFSLANGASPGGFEGTWTVDQAPAGAVVALNAGMFAGGAMWGWVVHEGEEYRAPQYGPLAAAIVVDSGGRVAFYADSAMDLLRAGGMGAVVEAFQSYPVVLRSGKVPPVLGTPSPLINLLHRDARLALGRYADGTLVVALTRFDAFGEVLGSVPVGLTVPEMSGLMTMLGVEDAVLLDGGISAQLMVQDRSGERKMWKGLRRVPLGLYGVSRSQPSQPPTAR